MFQDSEIVLKEENFSDFSDQSESRYRNAIPKAETSLYMYNQRRRTCIIREGGLSLFIGSHGKGTGAGVSHCNARMPLCQSGSKIVGHGIPEAQSTGTGGQWGRTSWGRT